MTEYNVFEVYDESGKRIAHAPLICDDTEAAERILRWCYQMPDLSVLQFVCVVNDHKTAIADGKYTLGKYTHQSFSAERETIVDE